MYSKPVFRPPSLYATFSVNPARTFGQLSVVRAPLSMRLSQSDPSATSDLSDSTPSLNETFAVRPEPSADFLLFVFLSKYFFVNLHH